MEFHKLLGGGLYTPSPEANVNVVATHAPLPAQEFYSVNQVAAITGLSDKHIRRAIVGGTLIASDLGTKDHPLYRVSRGNILKWMKDRENGAIPPMKRPQVVPPSRHHKPRKASV